MEGGTDGDDNEVCIEIDDGVAEHEILFGTPDQLMGDEVPRRIARMTNEGLEAAKCGVKSPEDMQFGAALACLGSSLNTFDIVRCVSTNQRSDLSNPDYVRLVKAIADIACGLDEVYKSIFLGCVKEDPDVTRISLHNSESFVDDVVKMMDKPQKGH